MPKPDPSESLSLFGDQPDAIPTPSVQPWRSTPADAWREDESPSADSLERHSVDALRRDLEFLRAMELHGEGAMASGIQRFYELHAKLVRDLVRCGERADDGVVTVRPALETLRELADLRLRILSGLDPQRLQKVMTAERRTRIAEHEIEQALIMAEFDLAAEKSELVDFDIPDPTMLSVPPGFIGPDMVDGLARTFIERMRAEQERRPLPARGGLGGLLRDLPVVWLDAMWDALVLGSDEAPRHRKERERAIAEYLTESGSLSRIVSELSGVERRLLAYLLERDGRVSAAAVTRKFGSDSSDGWFWNEEPPPSPLGRVRLHGLAFVGVVSGERRVRTVLVPRELVEPLTEALAVTRDLAEAEDALADASALRADVVEALEAAFPDGVVEPVWDHDDLDDVQAVLRHKLKGIRGAQLLYEIPLGGWNFLGPIDEFDDDENGDDALEDEEGDEDELERSYGLFFLSPRGKDFRFSIESEFLDDDGQRHPVNGVGRIGYAVAVSGVAPFALLRVTSLDSEDQGRLSIPLIDPLYFDDAGRPLREDEFLLSTLGEKGRGRLNELQKQIASVLEDLGIALLDESDAKQPVPWLEASGEVLAGGEDGELLSVEDALFFSYI